MTPGRNRGAEPIIVADVGGTFARLALAQVCDGQPPRLSGLRRYSCAEFASLAAILADFMAVTEPPLDTAVVAIAGLLEGDHLVNTNLPWPVSVADTRAQAGLRSLALINDFEAVAYAIPHVQADTRVALNGEPAALSPWPALVLGPGTGLGAALRFHGGEQPVLASEAGHAALTAGNALELEILRQMQQRWEHVDQERILSGSGLMNLYPCLCGLRGASPQWTSTEQLIAAAHAGDDPLAVETLEVFSAWLGSLAGDLAITFGARSVYLAGGISTRVAPFLHAGGFRARFLAKGVMGRVLAQVPVWRVEHGELGIMGAAVWHAARRERAVA
ncbi:glucokinase [Bacillus subtilis subsp. subtilis]|nr:glucokinase [Bacillus subtilis subsp. subtilis]